MAPLPAKYAWLAREGAPKMLVELLALYGTKEQPGTTSNPEIISWARELGLYPAIYSTDAIPWCGLGMAIAAKRAGWARPANPLWALNWQNFGRPRTGGPLLGDVMVFRRDGGGGHVATYVGEDETHWHILGCNQTDQVCIIRWPKTPKPVAVRQAPWRNAQPANVRRIILSPAGTPTGGSVV